MPRQGGDAGLHSLSTCGNEATARCRELVPRCASCGNAGSVQAVALRLKINRNLLLVGLMVKNKRGAAIWKRAEAQSPDPLLH